MRQDIEQTLATFKARTQGTPYVVERTKNGLKVSLNVSDHQWAALMSAQNMQEFFEVLVKFDKDSGFAKTTPQQREITYQLGATGKVTASVGANVFRGRIIHSKSSVATFSTDGTTNAVRSQAEWTFEGQELEDFVTQTLIASGWQVDEGRAGKIGLFAAIFGGVIAVISIVGAVLVNVVLK